MIKSLSINICICDLSPLKGKTIINFLITRWCAFVGNLVWTVWGCRHSGGRSVSVIQTSITQNQERNPEQENNVVTLCWRLLSLSLSLSFSVCQTHKVTATLSSHLSSCHQTALWVHPNAYLLHVSLITFCICACVRVCMCALWSLVPIASVSSCRSSFRSSTEEMGEFLTRSTRDEGSGSPCWDKHKHL